MLYLRTAGELDAHTLWIDSTHEYFETAEYELITLTELWDIQYFDFDAAKKN